MVVTNGFHPLVQQKENTATCDLNILQDYNREIREAVHEMFCCARLSTKGSLNACVMALLTNLKQYPQDKLSIWK